MDNYKKKDAKERQQRKVFCNCISSNRILIHFMWIIFYSLLFLKFLSKMWTEPGAYSGICPGGLNIFFTFLEGGSAPVGTWKPPEINRFHWSRGGLGPIAPPEYTSQLNYFGSVWIYTLYHYMRTINYPL